MDVPYCTERSDVPAGHEQKADARVLPVHACIMNYGMTAHAGVQGMGHVSNPDTGVF